MKPVMKKTGLSLLLLTGLLSAFVAGRWTGRLQSSLSAEANHPWDLQKKIGSMDFNCEKLVSAPRAGNFVIETTDAGSTLVVVFFNRSDSRVIASVLDSGGRYATDSWAIECK